MLVIAVAFVMAYCHRILAIQTLVHKKGQVRAVIQTQTIYVSNECINFDCIFPLRLNIIDRSQYEIENLIHPNNFQNN